MSKAWPLQKNGKEEKEILQPRGSTTCQGLVRSLVTTTMLIHSLLPPSNLTPLLDREESTTHFYEDM